MKDLSLKIIVLTLAVTTILLATGIIISIVTTDRTPLLTVEEINQMMEDVE